MAKNIGSLYVGLSVNSADMKKGLASAEKSVSSFSAKTSKLLKAGATAAVGIAKAAGAAMAAAGAAGIAAMVAGSKRIIKMGADLDHLSTQTGIAVASLMTIGQAYKDNGKDAKSAGKDIGKMQKAIFDAAVTNPTGEKAGIFKELGLNAEELMKMSPEAAFFAIGKAINSIENPTKRAALAMGVFGGAGKGLVTVFKGANLNDVNQSLGRMPGLMQKMSVELERVDTLMGRLPNKSDQFFTGFTAGIVGELLPALEKVDDMDFTGIGQAFGKDMAPTIKSIADAIASIDFAYWLEGIAKVSKALIGTIGYLDRVLDGFAMIATPGLEKSRLEAASATRKAQARGDYDMFNPEPEKQYDEHGYEIQKPKTSADFEPGSKEFMKAKLAEEWEKSEAEITLKLAKDEELKSTLPEVAAVEGLKDEAKTSLMPTEQKEERDTDEFIKRGLLVGGMNSAKDSTEEKQTKFLEEIRNALVSPMPSLTREAIF